MIPRPVYISRAAIETGFGDTEATWAGLVEGRRAFPPRANASDERPPVAASAAASDAELVERVLVSIGMADAKLAPVFAGLAATSPLARGEHASSSRVSPVPFRRVHVNACVASTCAVIDAAAAVASGRSSSAVALGARTIDPVTYELFRAGGLLSATGSVRPFMRDRDGLLLGDAAAALLLTDSPVDAAVRIEGWGVGGEGFDPVRPDPTGAGVSRVLQDVLGATETVDVVNVHGTGTELNDAAEAAAYRGQFGRGDTRPRFFGTKAATGHALEAVGALELSITAMGLERGIHPGTAAPDHADPALGVALETSAFRSGRSGVAVSVNAAFGGAVAAVVLGRTGR